MGTIVICKFFNSMLNGPRDLICSWEPCSTVLTKITLSACAWYVNTCIHFWNLNANPLVKILEQSNLGQIIVNTCSCFVAVVWKCIVAKIWNLEPLCLNPKKIYHDQFSMEIKLLFYWLLNSHGSTITLSNFIDP